MSLTVLRSLVVTTSDGEHEIQLCYGDITQLPIEDKVDYIFISSNPGAYAIKEPVTVMGALYQKLNINLKALSYDKQEDLRKNFNCWISKELPDDKPYRQLVCFEKSVENYMKTPNEIAVAEVFRAMMPICNNKNKSVITPLLAAGLQGNDREAMARSMLSAATTWIKAGLPLDLLKIVVIHTAQPIAAIFDEFKRSSLDLNSELATLNKDPVIVYDIYLVYCDADQQLADKVREQLIKVNRTQRDEELKIVTLRDVDVNNNTWHYDVVTAMMSSVSIVPLLTSSFMADSQCIDQYNLALCADRRTSRNLLIPFGCESLELPVYISAIQFYKSKDDSAMDKACTAVISKILAVSKAAADDSKAASSEPTNYDVFVSYCHFNEEKAKVLIETLTKKPGIRVFFDQTELRAGDQWQPKLYTALDNTRCVVALLSKAYFNSHVCNEELNVAVLRHLSQKKSLELILVCIEDISRDLPLFQFICPFDASVSDDSEYRKRIENVSTRVYQWLQPIRWFQRRANDSKFTPLQKWLDVQSLATELRQKSFDSNYAVNTDGVFHRPSSITSTLTTSTQPSSLINDQSSDVFVISSLPDRRYISFLTSELRRNKLQVCDKSTAEDGKQIETARCVVVMLSSAFCRSPRKVELLNLALGRARLSKPVYVVSVDYLPSAETPSYIQLVHSGVCIADTFWTRKAHTLQSPPFGPDVMDQLAKQKEKYGQQGSLLESEVLALMKAACDIKVICQGTGCRGPLPVEKKGVLASVVELYFTTRLSRKTTTTTTTDETYPESSNINGSRTVKTNELNSSSTISKSTQKGSETCILI